MTNALAKAEESGAVVPSDVSAGALEAALTGDMQKLSSDQRLKYLAAICESTGLNPLTKPFDYITLQGKLTLYANKGAAEQLRKIHTVNIEIVERKMEMGCIIVRVKASTPDGRNDEAIGAVPASETWKGDAIANAMMKAETKAKRRVTLSICGLGMIDESELETVRNHQRVDVMNGVETAGDVAQRLNESLTSSEKRQAVDVDMSPTIQEPEVMPDPEPEQSAHNEETPVEQSNPVEEKGSTSDAPRETGSDDPTLPDEITSQLESAIGAHGMDALLFLESQGWKPKGKPIEYTQEEIAQKILKNTARFIAAVNRWKEGGKK